jgi:hypothetical protein
VFGDRAHEVPQHAARFPLRFIETGGAFEVFGLTDLFLLGCIAFDIFKHRRLHPVFLWGTLLLVGSQPLRLLLGNTDAWMRFATWLVS